MLAGQHGASWNGCCNHMATKVGRMIGTRGSRDSSGSLPPGWLFSERQGEAAWGAAGNEMSVEESFQGRMLRNP